MIVYFTDRQLNILGQASTELPQGLMIQEDKKTEDIETGVAIFECEIPYDSETRKLVETCTEVGNYILRSYDSENEFYTIIETEADTKKQVIYIYAEDAGLDLLNEVALEYEADKAYSIDHYINKWLEDTGFEIGVNEAKGLTRKLSWDGEETVSARLASVATQFDNCEISYSYDIEHMVITRKYVNIYKNRGKDVGISLRLNEDIDSIETTKSIANVATSFYCTGGVPEDKEDPITLEGYKYDDGDFYTVGNRLNCRSALKKWSRYVWSGEPGQLKNYAGHIIKAFSYDTTSQAELCSRALAELKKAIDIEVNYKVEIGKLPKNVKIGDRVNIVDNEGELYLSTRILKLVTSVANQEHEATLGEYLIKGSGIHQKVKDLAAEFVKTSQSAARALSIANNAKTAADEAKTQADTAAAEAENAQQAANLAQSAANTAQESATNAQTAADNAQAAVDSVEESVASLETTVENVQTAADNAQTAAETAQSKADEAVSAAAQALADAADANAAVEVAQSAAQSATTKAETAQSTADAAKVEADTAKATADAAKLDAEKANTDIASLSEELETVSNTMQTDYARKTDLTEATASLQTQISQNAAEISSTASKVQTIDETANNAQEQAQVAQEEAANAKAQADQATADALAAQQAADDAATAASNAQSEADTAKAAAATAQSVADKAEADLETAKADLATVSSRVDATEEEIATAQAAVETAQAAADKAKADATEAATKAANAQTTADTAVTNAANAQAAADDAASKASIAQATADAAKGDAAAAQAKAEEAKEAAVQAQQTADTAATNATNAQTKADEAAATAAAAQSAADDADAKAEQAASDLATAKQNLADVTSRVDATEAEVEAAQQAVNTAQAAADKAKADAETAQATADQAKADAEAAQTVADNAKTAADNAQKAADDAQDAADAAQEAVDALAVRVTTAETKITQNANLIALAATKTEVTETLGGYYTKEETDAAIKVSADEINISVEKQIDGMQIGSRNLLENTKTFYGDNISKAQEGSVSGTYEGLNVYVCNFTGFDSVDSVDEMTDTSKQYVLSTTGTIWAYGEIGEVPTYTNLADPTSADWLTDYRLNSAGEPVAASGITTTNPIACSKGDILRVNIDLRTQAQRISATNINNGIHIFVGYFTNSYSSVVSESSIKDMVTYENGLSVYELCISGSGNTLYGVDNMTIRFCYDTAVVADSDIVITINEEIATTPVYGWYDTGLDPSSSGDSSADLPSLDVIQFKKIYPEKLGAVYTLSFYAKGSGDMTTYFYGATGYLQCAKVEQSNGTIRYAGDGTSDWTLTDTWERYWVTWTLQDTGDISIEKYILFRLRYGCFANICGVKLERGNKATDWTPAPEDVENDLNNAVDELNDTIVERNTAVVQDCESIIFSALESYAETEDFDTFKETVEAQLQILTDQISLNFTTTTEQINAVNDELQSTKTTLEKHFVFTNDGLTIKAGENTMGLRLDNDIISFTKNGEQFGWWDGEKINPGSIRITAGNIIQLGNGAIIVFEDGTFGIGKVGE